MVGPNIVLALGLEGTQIQGSPLPHTVLSRLTPVGWANAEKCFGPHQHLLLEVFSLCGLGGRRLSHESWPDLAIIYKSRSWGRNAPLSHLCLTVLWKAGPWSNVLAPIIWTALDACFPGPSHIGTSDRHQNFDRQREIFYSQHVPQSSPEFPTTISSIHLDPLLILGLLPWEK